MATIIEIMGQSIGKKSVRLSKDSIGAKAYAEVKMCEDILANATWKAFTHPGDKELATAAHDARVKMLKCIGFDINDSETLKDWILTAIVKGDKILRSTDMEDALNYKRNLSKAIDNLTETTDANAFQIVRNVTYHKSDLETLKGMLTEQEEKIKSLRAIDGNEYYSASPRFNYAEDGTRTLSASGRKLLEDAFGTAYADPERYDREEQAYAEKKKQARQKRKQAKRQAEAEARKAEEAKAAEAAAEEAKQ